MTLTVTTAPAKGMPAPWRALATLDAPERVMVAIVLAVALADVALAAAFGQAVAWGAFSISFLPAAGLLALGLYARAAKGLIVLSHLAIANAIYIGFSGVVAILVFLRFPVRGPLLDPALIRADAFLGFSWPVAIETLVQYPIIGKALGLVYNSSLPQIFVLIGFLVITGRYRQMQRALIAGMAGLLLVTAIWWIWPAVGPSVQFTIAPEMAERIGLVTNQSYSDSLMRLSQDGLGIITPGAILGVVGFPSYHTVMALMMIWYLRATPMFFVALALNLAMFPAILTHGGHHLMDVAAGAITFSLAAMIAAWLVPRR